MILHIIAAMERLNYVISRGIGEINIAYVEGVGLDGMPNDNTPNEFNDARVVFGWSSSANAGEPHIFGVWEATTEPGRRYTETPLNPKGAARIAFGQYQAWRIGVHQPGKSTAHEALVQRASVTVHRDLNKDYQRQGDATETGLFGINQHWGYGLPVSDIGAASAGCQVGRTKAGHRQFMGLVRGDSRYLLDKNYLFYTAILPASEVNKA